MSKKHFIALADVIRRSNGLVGLEGSPVFSSFAIVELADFCESQNKAFNRERWLAYIDGRCRPNGGAR